VARPLTGSRWNRGAKFYGSVPECRGSRRRAEASFDTATDRDAWLSAAVTALQAGRRPPDPKRYRDRLVVAAPGGDGPRPLFEVLAHGWLDEYYDKLRNADAERERDVRIMVENYLIPAFAGPVPADATAARRRLVEFVRRMALEPEWAAQDGAAQGPAGRQLLTIDEAVAACHRSKATVRRALRAGKLPGAQRRVDGRWLIPATELQAVVGRRSAAHRAVGRSYAASILWAHAKILEWGRAIGWDIADFERGVNALTPHEDVARKKPDTGLRRPLTIAELARVASHLHAAHQLVLWMMRVLGLRIAEAFGPHVGDLVDLGEVGLVVIQRQGGRPFLTRTRDGVETKHSKGTLKRAASHRVIVVPGALMVVFRIAVEAFHTDPATGLVDLDARLVPWIAKQGGGLSAFRSALEAALRREGFDLDSAGIEVVTHDLRKSLATDLAWNPDLDELAKRRVMGHKAGDDVFARVYTLDHPTLAPLVEIANALQADIAAQVATLLVPTEHRIPWRSNNPLRVRSGHIEAVLAEAGWQVEPGGAENPWCDSARVALELGIAETTARRWMRDQVVPSTTDTDEHGNARRRSRLSDVEAVRERLSQRILLRDLAVELNVGYYRAWRALRRLGVISAREGPPPRELVLTVGQADALRRECDRLSALFDRSMRVSAAATNLGVAFSTAQKLLRRGELIEDPERDAFGAQYVTRPSVEALRLARRGAQPVVVGAELVSLANLIELSGLSRAQLVELADRGLLERRDVERGFHVTVASLRRWAAGYRPDLLDRLGPSSHGEPKGNARSA
jgi:hypothetical protein